MNPGGEEASTLWMIGDDSLRPYTPRANSAKVKLRQGISAEPLMA